MRLLDLIAHGRTEPIRTHDGIVLPGAEQFSKAIRGCPVRYVITDELALCATQLAYADGDRLDACLDLVHVPAQSLWVEWMDAPRQTELLAIKALALQDTRHARRAGTLLRAAADGRSGELRTFWSTGDDLAYVSPVIVQFDLDSALAYDPASDPFAASGWTRVTAPAELGLDRLLDHVRFRFDPAWRDYYRRHCVDRAMRAAVLRANLGACAFEPPMLFALFLMLAARSALPRRSITLDRLNRTRLRDGKLPLLEHIEVSAPLFTSPCDATPSELERLERRSPRLHHVCGHIVRRGSTVFWRSPHMRGTGRLGQVRTRTVELTFGPAHRQRHATATPVE